MKENIAQYLDHTLLRPDTSLDDVKKMLQEAEEHGFATVCIPPHFVRTASRIAENSKTIKISTVVGFPLGYAAISSKSEEIKRAVDEGAEEIDAVINLAAYRSGNMNHFENDIQSMVRATHLKGKSIKLILESNLLSEQELLDISSICKSMEANFIKTGSGFFGPTKVSTVAFLKKNLPSGMQIKAAGGIRTFAEAKAMIEAGADRVGTSSAVEIVSSALTA